MKRRKLPLDSLDWVPLRVVFQAWGERNGSLELGEIDTLRALQAGKVRGMRRSPEPELLPPEFWTDREREIVYDADEVMLVDTPGRFFCWQPDLERMLGREAKPKPQLSRSTTTEGQARPGAPLKFDWFRIVTEIAFREANATKKERERSDLAEANRVRSWCARELKQRPSISELREVVKLVRARFRGPN